MVLNLISIPNNKIKYLDGLRGLAALIVVVHHFLLGFYPGHLTGNSYETHLGDGAFEMYISKSPWNILAGGNFAVCVFFVLSGYVLTKKLQEKETNFILFYSVKRYFRLFLPVTFTILLSHILLSCSLNYSLEAGVIAKSDWWFRTFCASKPSFDYLIKSIFIEVFFRESTFYNTAFWSMSIELLGSFLLFAAIILNKYTKNNLLLNVLLLFVVSQFNKYPYYCCFIGGLIISQLEIKKQVVENINLPILSFGACILGIYFGSFPISTNYSGYLYSNVHAFLMWESPVSYHVLGSILLLAGLVFNKKMHHYLENSYLLFLGRISFAVYLLHSLILTSWASFIFLKCFPLMGYDYSFLVSFFTSFIILILLSILMTRFIDDPSILLSEKIAKLLLPKHYKTEPSAKN